MIMDFRNTTTKELVCLSVQGDKDAFSELLNRHQKYIFSLAYKLTGNWDDASEITQRTFISAYKGITNFKGGSAISTWFYRITYNRAIDLRRERARLREFSITDAVILGKMVC